MSQAELVKDDIIMYNKKIIELNTELQMVPERCPLEVSEMCKMISDNKLKAENYTYLVRGLVLIIIIMCGLYYVLLFSFANRLFTVLYRMN